MIITKAQQVLRTRVEGNSIHTMTNRYTSGIVIPLKGSMDFVFSDTVIHCEKGHGIFLPQGSNYYIKGIENNENLLFNFEAESFSQTPFSIDIFDVKSFEHIFCDIERALAAKNRYKVFSLYYKMLDEALCEKGVKKQSERYVDEAERIILRELASSTLSCSYLASEINVSEVYLRKLFVKHRGAPTSEYIQALRMKKARAYLSEGYSVGETGLSVGYTDVYQFSRAYKKYYGHAPTKE